MSNTTTGGFIGDPAEAFTPPATGTCCGSTEAAAEAGACCDPVAKVEAIEAGAGCCG